MNTAAQPTPPSPPPPAWAARRERGSLLALKFMAWLAVTAGRPVARLLLHPITLYFLVFGRQETTAAPGAGTTSARPRGAAPAPPRP